ncbi:MAG TPA: ATP-binding cassette domain-containing protein [Candidatus Methylomirabilis sp.]|nr:ATP-binding cassette domain-containing protein [Candidatus Methylomirabilis sp.]
MTNALLLQASELRRSFRRAGRVFSRESDGLRFTAVDGVSFEVKSGETFAIVGESGCGKTTLARMLLRLIEPDSGEVCFDRQDLVRMTAPALRNARRHMQMVFQDPFGSLDPRMRVSEIVGKPLAIHHPQPQQSGKARAHSRDAGARGARGGCFTSLPPRVFWRTKAENRHRTSLDSTAQARDG